MKQTIFIKQSYFHTISMEVDFEKDSILDIKRFVAKKNKICEDKEGGDFAKGGSGLSNPVTDVMNFIGGGGPNQTSSGVREFEYYNGKDSFWVKDLKLMSLWNGHGYLENHKRLSDYNVIPRSTFHVLYNPVAKNDRLKIIVQR